MAKKIFFISLVFFLFFPLLTFAYWTEPSQPAPNGNVPPPLNQGLQASPSFQYTWDNIGIGTSSFTQKLEVVGNVNIRDNVSDWSGLTIQPSYPRGSLTANYISTEIAGTGATHKPIIFRTNDANRLTIDTNGRVGIGTTSPLALLDVNNKLLVSNEQITINAPLNLNLPGDFSLSSDLQFTNPIASYIKSYAPLYIEAGDPNQNYDLILRSAGGGQVVVDDNLNVVGSLSAGSYIIQDITASSNVTAPIFYDKDNTLYFLDPHADIDGRSLILAGTVGIGTTGPGAKLTIQADDDKDAGPILNLGGKVANQVESGRIRFTETIAGVSPYYQGGYIHYNGSTNILNIGVHDASDSLTSSDINAISILRTNGNVGIGTTGPAAKLTVQQAESTTLTDFTRAVSNVGLLIQTNYTVDAYTPGIFWVTANNNATKPKAGLWMSEHSAGSKLYLGTSNSYATGITNQAVTIDASGNVGIGTTGPVYHLDVRGGSAGGAALYVEANSMSNGNGSKLEFNGNSYNAIFNINANKTNQGPSGSGINIEPYTPNKRVSLYVDESDSQKLKINIAGTSGITSLGGGTNALTIQQNGNVGIGTTGPGAKLEVNGDIATARTNKFKFLETVGGGVRANISSGCEGGDIGCNYLHFNVGGNVFAMTIKDDGNVGIGTTSPTQGKLVVNGSIDVMNNKITSLATPTATSDAVTKEYVDSRTGGSTGGGVGPGTLIGQTLRWAGTEWVASSNLFNNDIKVGIGTTSPGEKFAVKGNVMIGESDSWVSSTTTGDLAVEGNVGIGVTGPLYKLDVSGDIRATATLRANYFKAGEGYAGTTASTGWYRIASNVGNRANAEFTLRDYISSGGHSTATFRVGVSYDYESGMSFTLLNHSYYGTPTFTKVRVWESNYLYDPMYIEVYVNRTGDMDFSIYDNLQSAGWTAVNWTAGGTPTGTGTYTAREFEINNLFIVGDYDDRFTIARGGNVGIGTNSPTTAKLVINPGTQPSIDAGSQRIINVATPTAPSDAVTKGYVDGASVSHALTADSADYATNAGAADNATYANSSLRATYLGSGFNITTDSQGNLEITGNVTITL